MSLSPVEKNDRHQVNLYLATLFCLLILAFATFSVVGRGSRDTFGSLDTIALLKVGTRALSAMILTFFLLQNWSQPGRKSVLKKWLWLVPFVLWAGATVQWSALKSVSIGQLASTTVLMAVCLSVGIQSNRGELWKKVLRNLALILLATSAALLAIHFVFPGWDAFERQGSGILHPTNAGATASLGLLLLVACRMTWGWRWVRLIWIPGVVIHLAALMFAANRVSFFLALVLPFIPTLAFANRKRLAMVSVAGCAVALGFLFLDPGFESLGETGDKVVNFVQREQSAKQIKSLSGREEMWKAMWQSHKESPIKGHGYFVTSETGRLKVWDEWGNWTAHNMFLHCLTTTGVIGAVLFFGSNSLIFLYFVGAWIKKRLPTRLFVALATFYLWYLVWGLFNSSVLGPLQPESLLFYSLVGIGLGVSAKEAPCPQVSESDAIGEVTA